MPGQWIKESGGPARGSESGQLSSRHTGTYIAWTLMVTTRGKVDTDTPLLSSLARATLATCRVSQEEQTGNRDCKGISKPTLMKLIPYKRKLAAI